MGNDPVRLGLIGASATHGWARLAHIPAIAAVPEVTIGAICTTRPETARAAADAYGVAQYFSDPDQLVACADVDAVCVLVRVPAHLDLTLAALRAGKPVYTEWPLGASLTEGQAMADAARTAGVATMIGLQSRFAPEVRAMQAMIADGYIGRVLSVRQSLTRASILERPANDMWQHDARLGANTSTIAFGHVIETLRFILGDVESIAARITRRVDEWRAYDTGETTGVTAPDTVMASARLADGAVASIHVATIPWAPDGHRLEVYGTEGTLVLTGPDLPQLLPQMRLQGAQGANGLADIAIDARFARRAGAPEGFAANVSEIYWRFAEAIRSGKAIGPDFGTALSLHRIIDAAQRSSRADGAEQQVVC